MKEKTFAFLTTFLVVFSSVSAQYADLLNDRNISWVAEYTADFQLNPINCDWGAYDQNNSLNVIYFNAVPPKNGMYASSHFERFFSEEILKLIKAGAFSLFADEQLELPLSQAEAFKLLSKTDTVIGPDPDTFEDKLLIIRNDLEAGNLTGFRVRQVFYYDKSERTFGSRLLALSPLTAVSDELGNFTEYKPLVWLKMEMPKNPDKIALKDLTYAFETVMGGNAPQLQNFVPKKGRMDFLQLIINEITSPAHLILDKNLEPVEPAKLRDYVQSTDTVTTYNPQTYEEETRIVQHNVIRDVERVGFVQLWFYDERKRLFFNRISAIAPLVSVKDSEGNLIFTKPLFYLKMK